jgi:hypothetical protein
VKAEVKVVEVIDYMKLLLKEISLQLLLAKKNFKNEKVVKNLTKTKNAALPERKVNSQVYKKTLGSSQKRSLSSKSSLTIDPQRR